MSAYSVKITPHPANSWQSCTLCSRCLDEPWVDVHNLNTDSYFNVCTPCLDTMNATIPEAAKETPNV